jgi:hypothetical protein
MKLPSDEGAGRPVVAPKNPPRRLTFNNNELMDEIAEVTNTAITHHDVVSSKKAKRVIAEASMRLLTSRWPPGQLSIKT